MPSRITFLAVWVLLLVLLGASMGVASLGLGLWQPVLIMTFAVASTCLVGWFDMHLRESSGTLKLFAIGTIIFLLIMFGLSLPDWLTR